MDYPKSVPGVGLVEGRFADEDVAAGRQGSLIPASWGNAVTEEILTVIRAAGLVPAEGSVGQLREALAKLATPAQAVEAESLKDFFTKCLAKGAGFYRADGANIPAEVRYAPGYFSMSAGGTWSFTANHYFTGRPVFFAGVFGDIPAETWKQYDPMSRANHTGTQPISSVTGLRAELDALTPGASLAFIYPNGGTAAAPANITLNSRYVMGNPFGNAHVLCVAEVLYSGVWVDPGWDGDTGTSGHAAGARATHLTSATANEIIIQTGASMLLSASNLSGGGHSLPVGTNVPTAPCRVKVIKLNGGM